MNHRADVRLTTMVHGTVGLSAAGFFVLFMAFLWMPVQAAFSNGQKEYTVGQMNFVYQAQQKIDNKNVTVEIKQDPNGKKEQPPAGRTVIGGVVNVKSFVNGDVLRQKTLKFENPITIVIHYPASLEKKYHVSLEQLSVFLWDPGLNRWLEVNQGKSVSNDSYEVSALSVNRNGRKATVTISRWPAADPCMCFGG